MKNYMNINLPSSAKINIWEKNNIKLLNVNINKTKFVFVFLDEKLFYIDKWGNSIVFFSKKKFLEKIKIEKSFNKFFKSIQIYYFSKIKFKGKGFRIKIMKKNKIIKFFFGKSHITIMLLKKIAKKRINKYKFILKSINSYNLGRVSKIITNIKKFNVYTLRGIRSSKQIIFKRKGKKGTYI